MISTHFRKRLALPKTTWQLCLLAIFAGFFSALLITFFIYVIQAIQLLYLNGKDNYSSLSLLSRFQVPIIGAIVILIFARIAGYKYVRTGIPFVLHRLKVANGVMPWRNTLNQFFGSALALGTGFSVGREGPAVHLGAFCGGFLGQRLALPYNAIRSLSACGIAAGIAACFNTPVAAVLFVMEVILREYKIHIFIPVMIAAIIGSMTTSYISFSPREFEHFAIITLNPEHYIYLVLLGLILGFIAFLFNRYLIFVIKYTAGFNIIIRLLVAALITGAVGVWVPYAMGTDASAINFSLQHSLELQLLLALVVAKMIMTISALGLGIPGGVIGPILGIGAVSGTIFSFFVLMFLPASVQGSDFALMGMAGLMAATLNAPLAALLCVVEMSHQIEIIVPAMIVISCACVSSGQFFRNRSIFVQQLQIQGLDHHQPPVEKSLQTVGVIAYMEDNLRLLSATDKQQLQQNNQQYLQQFAADEILIIKQENSEDNSSVDDATCCYIWQQIKRENNTTAITITPYSLIPVSSQATLAEAYLLLSKQREGGVYVYDKNIDDIIGIISYDAIRMYLLKGKNVQ